MTHIEPRRLHALNETTFLVTYQSRISAKNVGSTSEKINKWLGKPVVIPCNEVTATQLPKVLECQGHTTGLESMVLNIGLEEI